MTQIQDMVRSCCDFEKALEWKKKKETDEKEVHEVNNYRQTILQATLREELSALQEFLEELIKRCQNKEADDDYAFSELSDQDRETIAHQLAKYNIRYAIWTEEEEEQDRFQSEFTPSKTKSQLTELSKEEMKEEKEGTRS